MPLEAMACGCLVVAYNVGPMTEYLPSPFLHEQGDMLGIASSIEAIAQSFAEDVEKWGTISKTGRDIALQYSLQRESESVIATWEEILQKEQA